MSEEKLKILNKNEEILTNYSELLKSEYCQKSFDALSFKFTDLDLMIKDLQQLTTSVGEIDGSLRTIRNSSVLSETNQINFQFKASNEIFFKIDAKKNELKLKENSIASIRDNQRDSVSSMNPKLFAKSKPSKNSCLLKAFTSIDTGIYLNQKPFLWKEFKAKLLKEEDFLANMRNADFQAISKEKFNLFIEAKDSPDFISSLMSQSFQEKYASLHDWLHFFTNGYLYNLELIKLHDEIAELEKLIPPKAINEPEIPKNNEKTNPSSEVDNIINELKNVINDYNVDMEQYRDIIIARIPKYIQGFNSIAYILEAEHIGNEI